MTNLKTTKRALLSSVVALLVCFTMLLGTTFAWFTDSVTSNGNIIQTGTLEIGMYWMEGDEDPTTADWADASEGAIFNNTKWEPGYVEAKHIKIANEGTLALKYKLLIVPSGEVEALADVIDVYYIEGATQLTRDMLATATPVGTLRDLINDTDGAAHGALLPVGETATDTYERVGEVTATIAFKMREDAGNEYQGMSIGIDFSIQLLATQYTFEEDSFDNQYDKDALYPVVSAKELVAALSEGKDVVLANDFVMNEPIKVNKGETSTIDMNGYDLNGSLTFDVQGENTVLNLVNSSDMDSTVVLENGDFTQTLNAQNGGTINIDGVDVEVKSQTSDRDGADWIIGFPKYTWVAGGGTVNMYDGDIIADGIFFWNQGGTFNMYGGTITMKAGVMNNYSNNGIAIIAGGSGATEEMGPFNINLYGGKIVLPDGTLGVMIQQYSNLYIGEDFVFECNGTAKEYVNNGGTVVDARN